MPKSFSFSVLQMLAILGGSAAWGVVVAFTMTAFGSLDLFTLLHSNRMVLGAIAILVPLIVLLLMLSVNNSIKQHSHG